MKSKAWVLVEPGRIEQREFDVRPPEPDQVLVRNLATSVCASDPKIVAGKTSFNVYPLVFGHEIAGRAAAVGRDAAREYGLKEGDLLTIEPTIPCGRCRWCRTQYDYHKCRPLKAYGVTMPADQHPALFGGYADYMYLLPGSLVYKVEEGVPPLAACLSSVIGNGVRWARNLTRLEYGDSLAVSGVGSQGLATLIAARERGAGPIVMLGLTRDRHRFELALEFGADHVIDVETDNPLEAVPNLIGGPPDAVVETSGAPGAIDMALKLVRPLGRVAVIGLSGGKTVPLSFDDLVLKGVTISSDHAQAGMYPDAMRIIHSRKYAIEKINNVLYPLDDLPRALKDTADPPEGFIKGAVVFEP